MFKFLFRASKKVQASNLRRPEENIPEPEHELQTSSSATLTVKSRGADLIKAEIVAKDTSAENEILFETLLSSQETIEEALLTNTVLSQEIDGYRNKITQLERDKKKSIDQLNHSESDVNQLKDEVRHLQRALESAGLLEQETLLSKKALTQEVEGYRNKITQFERDQKQTIDQLNHSKSDVNQLKEEVLHLQRALESAGLLEQKVSSLNQQCEALAADKLGLQEKISKIEIDLIGYSARLENYQEENLALITSLNQIQEELEQHFLQKQQVQQEYNSLRYRWRRIERNHPSLLDYDDIRLITVNTVSTFPYLVWEARNFYHANVHYPRFHLVTLLNEGRGGMAVLDSESLEDSQAANRSLSKNVVFPHLLASPQLIAQNYRLLGSVPWKRSTSGIALLEEILQNIWPKGQFPKDMDPSFWRSSLAQLLLDLKRLPKMVTFEKVSLKRELRNVDYEHLWLEIDNVQFGKDYFFSKFEMRIGASLVQPQGFSRYPKFEFPLIGGRAKPFESWYAESSDEHGSKFEVRFDLNKKEVDLKALSKLSRPDLIFLINVILGVPQFIKHLDVSKVPVARTWAPWRALVEEANVLVAKILYTLVSPPLQAEENLQPSKVNITSNDHNTYKDITKSDSSAVRPPPEKRISKAAAKATTKTTSKSTSKVAASKDVSKLAAKKAIKKK
jgi:hypothetical protein